MSTQIIENISHFDSLCSVKFKFLFIVNKIACLFVFLELNKTIKIKYFKIFVFKILNTNFLKINLK